MRAERDGPRPRVRGHRARGNADQSSQVSPANGLVLRGLWSSVCYTKGMSERRGPRQGEGTTLQQSRPAPRGRPCAERALEGSLAVTCGDTQDLCLCLHPESFFGYCGLLVLPEQHVLPGFPTLPYSVLLPGKAFPASPQPPPDFIHPVPLKPPLGPVPALKAPRHPPGNRHKLSGLTTSLSAA